MVDEKRIAFLMKKLGISREEALDLEGYDDDVDHNRKTEHDLTPEQQKVVQEMNRKKEHKKYGSVHRERKPNDLKIAIMAELVDFLSNSCEFTVNDAVLGCENVELTNISRMLHFCVGEKEFDLQLIEKRPKKD